MNKRFLVVMAVLILVFVGFVVVKGQKDKQNNQGNSSVQPTEHKSGAGKKKVTLLEYGDFQCPVCGEYFPILEQVRKKYGDDITFQFRHFPITQIHQNAMSAHRAAEASAKQNKFWEMYELLYQRQQAWSSSQNASQIMEDYASELGMNVEQFKNDYKSTEINALINADYAAGQKIGVEGTPTFFINNEKVTSSPRSVDDFSKLIDEAIKKAEN